MKHLILPFALSLFATGALAEEFTVSFDWDGLKRCANGRPNTVGNPVFTLSDVPAGTNWLYFKLTDQDARSYNHGGGWIAFDGGNATTPDVFRYKSPCPPNGSHTYTWTVTATSVQGDLGNPLGFAEFSRNYPK